MVRRREVILGAIGAATVALAGSRAASAAHQDVSTLIWQAVGTAAAVAGVVAVVADEHGTQIVTQGDSGAPDVLLNADTVFEIGSISKVLTALLLAEMVSKNEVSLLDPISKYLPSSLTIHQRSRPISLLDLATYTAGLPNTPTNFRPPLSSYTVDRLYEFLSAYISPYEPGTHYEYSNLAFGILGVALANRAGCSYEELLIGRICDPLGLDHTRIVLTDDMQRHLAQGHGKDLKPRGSLELPVPLQGAGAVRSNARNLEILLKVFMGQSRTRLNRSCSLLLETRRDTTLPGTKAALGWFISAGANEEIVWKSGLTDGFTSFMGFSKRRSRGVLLLSNLVGPSLDVGMIKLGMQLVNPNFDPGDVHLIYSGSH